MRTHAYMHTRRRPGMRTTVKQEYEISVARCATAPDVMVDVVEQKTKRKNQC